MRYFLILIFSLLTACGSALPSVKPFKMDIQQGNVVTSKMLLQLRPGMTKSQVRFIMGSPLIVDSFHKDRWDYFYQMRQAGKIVEQRRVILDFDKDLLTKVRGDVVPEGTAGAVTGNESAVAKTITVEPKPKQEEGVLDKLKFWKKDNAAKEVVKPKEVAREKSDALEANSSAPSGDAPISSVETPSVLAVPIGGVLAPEVPAVETPSVEAPVITAPVAEDPVVVSPVIESPAIEVPRADVIKPEIVKTEVLKPEVLKPVEVPKAEAVKPQAPKPQAAITEAPKVAPMPATKAGERLIFRMDRNLNVDNLQAPVEDIPTPAVENLKIDNATSTSAKPKKLEQQKIEPPLPTEEAPGYFERMLEKIGF